MRAVAPIVYFITDRAIAASLTQALILTTPAVVAGSASFDPRILLAILMSATLLGLVLRRARSSFRRVLAAVFLAGPLIDYFTAIALHQTPSLQAWSATLIGTFVAAIVSVIVGRILSRA
ncbi:MAG: hypothetical protein NTX17_00930 [Candidatus Eisenbacteria bacterium]|nr:hypothetical protein [Candidatus Eisenbacteria bacterium]